MILRVPGKTLLLRAALGRGTVSEPDGKNILSRPQMVW